MRGKTKSLGLGDILIRDGRIRQEQLEAALAEQVQTRERLGEILCRHGFITPADLLDALGRQLGLARFDPAKGTVEPAALEVVPLEFARRHNVLPVRMDGDTLYVAVSDPLDVEAIDDLKRMALQIDRQIEILLSPGDALEKTRESSYGRVEGTRNVSELIDRVVVEINGIGVDDEPDALEAERRAHDAGIVNLVDQIIAQALQERATDIHVEPQEKGLVIRYRVDGMLYDALTPPRAVYTGAVSRVKILCNMDIAERRAPQDGRFTHKSNGTVVDIRVSAVPTIHGEKLVLRLLNKTSFNFSLRDLGFSEADFKLLTSAIHHPYGMVLLSGPTGSGKSTTLYASLLELRDETLNIMTVEDPVEYQIARINQIQVNERKKLTFATALRSFLRQDPDVIMVGEIRDRDTAEIAVRAALTGHMVFSTIHANDAPSTAVRLVSMGVEPFMAASALTLVVAQRLVRRNCPHCLEEYRPAEEILLALGVPALVEAWPQRPRFVRGAGCAACRNRGYRGRIAVVEMMDLTLGLRQQVAESRPAVEIRRLALEQGMRTLRASGLEKALDGVTTVEEVLRVCMSDE
jgi:type IV pilus assembly protein PilB